MAPRPRALWGAALLLAVLLLLSLDAPPAWAAAAAEGDAAGDAEKSSSSTTPSQADVLQLTSDTFAETIEHQTAPALVKFVAGDALCPACAPLEAEFRRVAANLKGLAPVGSVDCGSVAATRTCRSFAAHQFPKVLVFKPGSRVNPYTGGAMKDFAPHAGPLTAKALLAAVTDTLDASLIAPLNSSAGVAAWLQQQQHLARVLVFTDKPAPTTLAKGLSWAYARRLAFAEVRPADAAERAALSAAHGVEALPTLQLLEAGGGGARHTYSGLLKAPQLRAFLDAHAPAEPPPAEGAAAGLGGGAGPGAAGDPLASAAGKVAVQALTLTNLTRDIDASPEMWLVAFYAPPPTTPGSSSGGDEAGPGSEACQAALASLHALVQEVQGVVRYGSLDVSGVEAGSLQAYEVDGNALRAAPCTLQLVLLPHGTGKAAQGEAAAWTGGLDDAKGLQEWILKAVPDLTRELSNEGEVQAFLDATADDLPLPPPAGSLRERGAPVGKVLLFTSKAEAPGIFRALAASFSGHSRLLFAWARTTQDGPGLRLMQKMNVRKAPALAILFPLPPKPLGDVPDDVPNRDRDNMAMQQYMGPLKFQKMAAWLTAMSALTGMAYKVHAGATQGPAPEDFEVRSQAQLQASCYDKPGLCMLTLLDGRSADANKHRDAIKAAAGTLSGQPVNWVVVDASRQPSLRRAYGFTSDQLPALVALSTRRMRFAQGAAPFGEESAKQLVTKVLTGAAVTLPLPELPLLVDGGEPVPEDAGEEALAEEFRLDDIMAEEVKSLLSKEERLKQAEEEVRREQEAAKKTKKKKKKGSKKKGGKKKQKQQAASSKDEL